MQINGGGVLIPAGLDFGAARLARTIGTRQQLLIVPVGAGAGPWSVALVQRAGSAHFGRVAGIKGGSVAEIEAGAVFVVQAAACCKQPRRFQYIQVVPDGVARVRLGFVLRAPGGRSSSIHLVTVPVIGNVALATIDGGPAARPKTQVWLGRDGRVLRRLSR